MLQWSARKVVLLLLAVQVSAVVDTAPPKGFSSFMEKLPKP